MEQTVPSTSSVKPQPEVVAPTPAPLSEEVRLVDLLVDGFDNDFRQAIDVAKVITKMVYGAKKARAREERNQREAAAAAAASAGNGRVHGHTPPTPPSMAPIRLPSDSDFGDATAEDVKVVNEREWGHAGLYHGMLQGIIACGAKSHTLSKESLRTFMRLIEHCVTMLLALCETFHPMVAKLVVELCCEYIANAESIPAAHPWLILLIAPLVLSLPTEGWAANDRISSGGAPWRADGAGAEVNEGDNDDAAKGMDAKSPGDVVKALRSFTARFLGAYATSDRTVEAISAGAGMLPGDRGGMDGNPSGLSMLAAAAAVNGHSVGGAAATTSATGSSSPTTTERLTSLALGRDAARQLSTSASHHLQINTPSSASPQQGSSLYVPRLDIPSIYRGKGGGIEGGGGATTASGGAGSSFKKGSLDFMGPRVGDSLLRQFGMVEHMKHRWAGHHHHHPAASSHDRSASKSAGGGGVRPTYNTLVTGNLTTDSSSSPSCSGGAAREDDEALHLQQLVMCGHKLGQLFGTVDAKMLLRFKKDYEALTAANELECGMYHTNADGGLSASQQFHLGASQVLHLSTGPFAASTIGRDEHIDTFGSLLGGAGPAFLLGSSSVVRGCFKECATLVTNSLDQFRTSSDVRGLHTPHGRAAAQQQQTPMHGASSARRGSYSSSVHSDGPSTVAPTAYRGLSLSSNLDPLIALPPALVAAASSPAMPRDGDKRSSGSPAEREPWEGLIAGARCALAVLRALKHEADGSMPLLLGFQLFDCLDSRNSTYLNDLCRSIAAFALQRESVLFSLFREPTSLVGYPSFGLAADKVPKDSFMQLWVTVMSALVEVSPIPYDAIAWCLSSLCYVLRHLPHGCSVAIQCAVVCSSTLHDVLGALRKDVSFHTGFASCLHYVLELFDRFLEIDKPSEMLIAVFVSLFASSTHNPITTFLRTYVRRVVTADDPWALFGVSENSEKGTAASSSLSPRQQQTSPPRTPFEGVHHRRTSSPHHNGKGSEHDVPYGSEGCLDDTLFWPNAFDVSKHRVRLLQHYRCVCRFFATRHHGGYLSLAHETQGEHPADFLINPVEGIALILLSDVAPQDWLAMQIETLKLLEEVASEPAVVSPLLQHSSWVATYTRFLYLAFLEAYHSEAFANQESHNVLYSGGLLRALSALCQHDTVARSWALKLGVVKTLVHEIDLEQSVNDIRERQLKKTSMAMEKLHSTSNNASMHNARGDGDSEAHSPSASRADSAQLSSPRGGDELLRSDDAVGGSGGTDAVDQQQSGSVAGRLHDLPVAAASQGDTVERTSPLCGADGDTSTLGNLHCSGVPGGDHDSTSKAKSPRLTTDGSVQNNVDDVHHNPLHPSCSSQDDQSSAMQHNSRPSSSSMSKEDGTFLEPVLYLGSPPLSGQTSLGSPPAQLATVPSTSSLMSSGGSGAHRPSFAIPKLSLSLAPPPLYFTSNGDTGAVVEATMSNMSFVKSGSFAFPTAEDEGDGDEHLVLSAREVAEEGSTSSSSSSSSVSSRSTQCAEQEEGDQEAANVDTTVEDAAPAGDGVTAAMAHSGGASASGEDEAATLDLRGSTLNLVGEEVEVGHVPSNDEEDRGGGGPTLADEISDDDHTHSQPAEQESSPPAPTQMISPILVSRSGSFEAVVSNNVNSGGGSEEVGGGSSAHTVGAEGLTPRIASGGHNNRLDVVRPTKLSIPSPNFSSGSALSVDSSGDASLGGMAPAVGNVMYIPPLVMSQALRSASTPGGGMRSPSARANRTVRLVEPSVLELELPSKSAREASPEARIPSGVTMGAAGGSPPGGPIDDAMDEEVRNASISLRASMVSRRSELGSTMANGTDSVYPLHLVMNEAKFAAHQRSIRRVYMSLDVQVELLHLILTLIVSPNGTLDSAYTSTFTVRAGRKVQALFHLHMHLNHDANAAAVHALWDRVIGGSIASSSTGGGGAAAASKNTQHHKRGMRLLLQMITFRTSLASMYERQEKVGVGGYGAVVAATLNVDPVAAHFPVPLSMGHWGNAQHLPQSPASATSTATSVSQTRQFPVPSEAAANIIFASLRNERVAVKMGPVPHHIDDRETLVSFFNEVLLLTHVQDMEETVRLLDCGCDGTQYAVVMPLYRCSLKEWRRQVGPVGQLPPSDIIPQCLHLFSSILQALCEVHRRRIVHHDIKLDNVFLDDESHGNAKAHSVDEIRQTSHRSEAAGSAVGIRLGDWGESEILPFVYLHHSHGHHHPQPNRHRQSAFDISEAGLDDTMNLSLSGPPAITPLAGGGGGGSFSPPPPPMYHQPHHGHSHHNHRHYSVSSLKHLYAKPRGTECIRAPEALLPHKFFQDRQTFSSSTSSHPAGSFSPGASGHEDVALIVQKSDVWAVGCLLYELLVGELLFEEADFGKMMHRVTSDQGELLPDLHQDALSGRGPRGVGEEAPMPPPHSSEAGTGGFGDAMKSFLLFVLERDPFKRPTMHQVRERWEELVVRSQLHKEQPRMLHTPLQSTTAATSPREGAAAATNKTPGAVSRSASRRALKGLHASLGLASSHATSVRQRRLPWTLLFDPVSLRLAVEGSLESWLPDALATTSASMTGGGRGDASLLRSASLRPFANNHRLMEASGGGSLPALYRVAPCLLVTGSPSTLTVEHFYEWTVTHIFSFLSIADAGRHFHFRDCEDVLRQVVDVCQSLDHAFHLPSASTNATNAPAPSTDHQTLPSLEVSFTTGHPAGISTMGGGGLGMSRLSSTSLTTMGAPNGSTDVNGGVNHINNQQQQQHHAMASTPAIPEALIVFARLVCHKLPAMYHDAVMKRGCLLLPSFMVEDIDFALVATMVVLCTTYRLPLLLASFHIRQHYTIDLNRINLVRCLQAARVLLSIASMPTTTPRDDDKGNGSVPKTKAATGRTNNGGTQNSNNNNGISAAATSHGVRPSPTTSNSDSSGGNPLTHNNQITCCSRVDDGVAFVRLTHAPPVIPGAMCGPSIPLTTPLHIGSVVAEGNWYRCSCGLCVYRGGRCSSAARDPPTSTNTYNEACCWDDVGGTESFPIQQLAQQRVIAAAKHGCELSSDGSPAFQSRAGTPVNAAAAGPEGGGASKHSFLFPTRSSSVMLAQDARGAVASLLRIFYIRLTALYGPLVVQRVFGHGATYSTKRTNMNAEELRRALRSGTPLWKLHDDDDDGDGSSAVLPRPYRSSALSPTTPQPLRTLYSAGDWAVTPVGKRVIAFTCVRCGTPTHFVCAPIAPGNPSTLMSWVDLLCSDAQGVSANNRDDPLGVPVETPPGGGHQLPRKVNSGDITSDDARSVSGDGAFPRGDELGRHIQFSWMSRQHLQ